MLLYEFIVHFGGYFIEKISEDVLAHIDLDLLESGMEVSVPELNGYPFEPIEKRDGLCLLVKDKNFSFVYHDNLEYLKELYSEVRIIESTEDEEIDQDAVLVIIPGGYVESQEAYARIENSNRFKTSLQKYAKRGSLYAEYAGLIYLGESCDEKEMSGILPITFELTNKRERLGYYKCEENGVEKRGHAFHYTRITSAPPTEIKLYKVSKKSAKDGGYKQDKITATYLHTMWRLGDVI